MSKKSIEITLQKSLLQHFRKKYSAFVSAIQTLWIKEIIDLSDIIFRIIHHAAINKANNENTIENTKILFARIL